MLCKMKIGRLLFAVFCLQKSIKGYWALDLSQCRNSLGMQSGQIPDAAITASSSFDDASVGPKNARIRTETNGGAWCPRTSITLESYEYLQIDLGQLTVVTMVEIQGRFGNGQGQEYTEEFLLEYQREDGEEWMRFKNKQGEERFEGNENTYSAEMRGVSPPIIGKRLRFIPYCRHPRTVCMRVEIYGCEWEAGVLSYSMRQGDKRGAEVDFFDFAYDGTFKSTNHLHDGLGQLMDGEEGDTNFRLDPQELGIKGYEWVGWKSDTATDPAPVSILFKFDAVRNFSSVILNCNNYFTKDVRVFKTAVIYYSIGGKYFMQKKDKFYFIRDTIVEYARNVQIRLDNIIARYIKLELYFDAKWILISEVQFDSKQVIGNVNEELPPPTTITMATIKSPRRENKEPEFELETNGARIDLGIESPGSVPLSKRDDLPHKTEEKKSYAEQYLGIIIGALSVLIIVLFAIVMFIIICHKRQKNYNNRLATKHVSMNMNHMAMSHPMLMGKFSNGSMYKGLATGDCEDHVCDGGDRTFEELSQPKDLTQDRNLPDVPYSSEMQESRDYDDPDFTNSALRVALPPFNLPKPPVHGQVLNQQDIAPPMYDALYAAADVILNSQCLNIPNLQGATGSSAYSVPNAELLLSLNLSVVEFPREKLHFLEVLGEGQFGEVHLCEAMDVAEYLHKDCFINRNPNQSVLVAVKTLCKDADDRAKRDFQKEITIMSQLKDPNIVQVLGVCVREEHLCMIVEYMKYGDLNQFLLNHVPESPITEASNNGKTLSYGCLIYMSSQIASGMKYLESLNMVHRDLATRNCLVGSYFTIKISDFGMSRSLYSADYYRIEGRVVLPIRWMAWESVLLGKFTTKSDVWSFGITLWEILTFAREQPFDTMNDEQVIENSGHYFRNNNKQLYLQQPGNCPKEIYDLMLECWNRKESERPSFREIQMFLQRRNMGYNPKDERMNQLKVPVC